MERLTIKELAPYLPYNIGVEITRHVYPRRTVITILETSKLEYCESEIYSLKPLIRPLSYLTEEIEHNGERFVPYQRLYQFASNMGIHKGTFEHMLNNIIEGSTHITEMPYYLVKNLFQWHFDVFGLIDRNLALPIDGKEVEGE